VISNSADESVNHRINSLVNNVAIAMPHSIFAKTLALPLLDRFLLGTLFANLRVIDWPPSWSGEQRIRSARDRARMDL